MSQSNLHLGVVMDPISDIAYKKDTTMAMLWAAQERGYTLHYMEQEDLFLNAGQAYARMRPLTCLFYTTDPADDQLPTIYSVSIPAAALPTKHKTTITI